MSPIRPIRPIGPILAFLGCALAALAAEPPAADPVEQAFEQLRTYDYGQNDKALHVLELELVRFAKDAPRKARMAERLAAVLADPKASQAVKVWTCQQLLVLGTEAQVPVLVKMLDDPKTVEIARYTLEGIPGEASLAALREALGRLTGLPRIGAINSLGIRRDGASVGALAKLLAGADPLVAAAAAEALGKIGTSEAAAALAKAEVPAKALAALQDAQLRCAERLAASGDAAGATALYELVWASKRPGPWRLGGLIGLAKVAKEKATPLVIETLGSDDPLFQATAVRLTCELPGPKVTAALVERLEKLDAKGQALLLSVLAERGDRSAADAVAKRMDDKDPTVRVAAILAMAGVGDASTVEPLARLAAAQQGAVQQAARTSLERLAGADIEPKLLAMAAEGEPAVRMEAFRALAGRRSAAATPVLLQAAKDADERIRSAAFDALAVVGQADCYRKLVELLVAAPPVVAGAAEKAVVAVGGRLPTPAERLGPVLAALGAASAQAKPSLLRVLAGCGGAEALQAVRPFLADADATIKDAAVRALASWPDDVAAPDLLKLAKDSDSATHRVLALRGYLRLAQAPKDAGARLKMLEQVPPIATTPEAKKMLLASLGDAADPGALVVVGSFLGEGEVKGEAAAAALRLGKALARTEKKAVQATMRKIIETFQDKAVTDQAEAVIAETLKPSPEQASARALQPDKARSEARKKDLAKTAPKGYRVACYLDCGPDAQDGAKGGPILRVVDGQAYAFGDADAATIRYVTIFYTGDAVVFEAAGLNPKKACQLGFSWWDYDHDTRVQSVSLATGKGQKSTQVVAKTKLPSHANNQPPQEKTAAIPRELYADGTLRISFTNEGSPNVVVSEVWLLESEAEGTPGPAGIVGATLAAATREGEAPAEPKGREPATRVLVVTGQDSAHNWRATAPALADVLRKDPRLDVKVVENPDFLASDELKQYDVVVLHFQNPKPLPKTQEDRANLQKFVEDSKGLVVIHFGCGAFQEWPEFRNLAGRAWDPKLRAHDPHGEFQVNITDAKHPITEGMPSFETTDELYTCLAGDAPITLLATATSKVDKKDYPMVFILTVGKGRVFHTALGHDVRALTNPPVAELLRRATAWAAGLPAAPPR